jgi:phosphatidylglycerophosphate synthase
VLETALIQAPTRASHAIFGRPLLERLVLACERAGMTRIVIEAPASRRDEVLEALGPHRNDRGVSVVESFGDLLTGPNRIEAAAPCIAIRGNVVLLKSHLNKAIADAVADPAHVIRVASVDAEQGGEIATGPLGALVELNGAAAAPHAGAALLPFALNGRPEDRDEAEVRLARSLRFETAQKDAPFARYLDRHLSWRLSLRLARTGIRPNQVTIANTMLGMVSAWMFAIPGYWSRVVAALLFLLSTTLDGVDGELARLQMSETEFGGKLDMITDNLVHVAVFAGVYIGCARTTHSAAFIHLIPIFMVGFALAALSTYLAFKIRGPDAQRWLNRVDQVSGRDFAYLLAGFAIANHLDYFAWGTAFGVYVFAFILLGLTWRRSRRAVQH